jgi:putative intracellular protease/amidase
MAAILAAGKARCTVSVCSGAFLLVQAGLLEGKTILYLKMMGNDVLRCLAIFNAVF